MNRKVSAIAVPLILLGMFASGMAVSADSNVKIGGHIGVAAGTAITPAKETEPEESEKTQSEQAIIAATIDRYLDAIISDNCFDVVSEYIEAHKAEFARITELGEDALPYLQSISETIGDQDWYSRELCRAYIVSAAIYAIKPELYEPAFVSPDGKYTFKAVCGINNANCTRYNNGRGVPYDSINIIENETGKCVRTFSGGFACVTAEWSPDSRYVAMTVGEQTYFSNVFIFDMVSGHVNYMPYLELTSMIENELSLDISDRARLINVDEWLPDNEVRISVKIRTTGYDGPEDYVVGWYTYNLETGKITGTSFESAK